MLPPLNIFKGKYTALTKIPPSRLAGLYDHFIVSPESIHRASLFVPRVSDIIVCSPPGGGGRLVADIVRTLEEAEPPPVEGICIESRCNSDEWLSEGIALPQRRVFETHMVRGSSIRARADSPPL